MNKMSIEKLSASNISCKRVGGQEIIERCHEDISVKKKYIIAFSVNGFFMHN